MMETENSASHQELADLLPEYALGLLPEDEATALERHLAGCPACRQELGELTDTVQLLAFAAPPARPHPQVKDALFARLSLPSEPTAAGEGTAGARPRPVDAGRPLGRQGAGRWRRLLASVVAAAALLALLAWNVALQRQLDDARRQNAALATRAAEQGQIVRLLYSPTAAHALTESDLTPRPVGYIYAEPDSAIGLMLAYRMPPLPPDQRYQLWLILPDGTRESGGLFTVDANGNGHMVVHAPGPFGRYRAVGITAEPWEGSPGPTGPRVVGGSLQ